MTSYFRPLRGLAALLGAGLLVATAAPAYAYSALYVFGDSLSDAGNVSHLTSGSVPPYPYVGGHFSNGKTWAEDLAPKLGLGVLKPSTIGGTDYAYGYAKAAPGVPLGDPLPAKLSVVPDVGEQVTDYLSGHGGKADPSALYAVWIGSNDILDAFDGYAKKQITYDQIAPTITEGLVSELAAIGSLIKMGADHLLIGEIPDLGLIPALNANPLFSSAATLAAENYNTALEGFLKATYPGEDIKFLDTFGLIKDAVDDPSKYGFTDVKTACFPDLTSGTGFCTNPDQHLFWDSVHPTRVGHEFIADLALQTLGVTAVPLPSSAPMFAIALLALVATGYGFKWRRAAIA